MVFMALGALLLELLKRFLQKSALDDKVNDCTQQHHQKGVVEVLLMKNASKMTQAAGPG